MKPKELIDQMISTYPRLFKNSWDCANYLFLTNGNGHEWRNGELVDTYCNDNTIINNLNDAINRYFLAEGSEDYYPKLNNIRLLKLRIKNIREGVKVIIDHFSKGESRYNIITDDSPFYLNNYLLGLNVPDDITNDWKDYYVEVFSTLVRENRIPVEYKDRIVNILNKLQ